MIRIRHLDGLDIVRAGLTRARLTLRNTVRKSYSLNVIGEKTGSEFPDEIVVCGHYDSSLGISGASDNAGGTAVMMELARVLAGRPTKRTLRFIACAASKPARTAVSGTRHAMGHAIGAAYAAQSKNAATGEVGTRPSCPATRMTTSARCARIRLAALQPTHRAAAAGRARRGQ